MVDAFCFYIFNGNSCSLSLVRQNSKNDCFFPRHCRYIVCRSFRGHNSRNLTTIKFRALFVDTTQQQLADGASKKSEHETPFVRPRTNIQFVGYIYIGSEAVNGGTSQNTIILFFFSLLSFSISVSSVRPCARCFIEHIHKKWSFVVVAISMVCTFTFMLFFVASRKRCFRHANK